MASFFSINLSGYVKAGAGNDISKFKAYGRNFKRTALLIVPLCTLLFFPVRAAAVFFTPEPTGSGDTVYVAGNPNWYPVEYYDEESQSYRGILPELLEQVAQKTGLKFTYVESGRDDKRRFLAENKQVELISGCRTDDSWIQEDGLQVSASMLSIPAADGSINVCLAFTQIADEELISCVEKALTELTSQEIAGISVQFLMEHESEPQFSWVFITATAAAVLLVLNIILAVRLRRYRKTSVQDERIDSLTDIWNKNYFIEFFEKFISDQYRNLYCVAYIGFDIVRVNQYYGESAAEEQLRFAANELQLSTRDNEVIARVSGGGFAVARPGSSEQEIQTWITQLLERLNQYTDRYKKDYRPLFRAGIYKLQSSDRNCETALFNARQGYRQAISKDIPFAFARTEYLRRENEQLQLKKQTLDALQNREFHMFLQLVVRGKDGEICGGEAVSRWEHPQKGLLFPGRYIELMEAEGTITELDFYIFEEACRQLEQWKKEGRRLYLSCNFSRITIGRASFVPRVENISKRFCFDHDLLVMEITEDAVETNKQVAFDNISRCKDMGFRIALDDAGSGYTSFADLRDYPIDVVKIDRSILNSAVTLRGAALLRGITALVHNLDMRVLCEGAETKAQAEMLRDIGCDYIQGYYFYRPLPLKEINRILKEKYEMKR